VVFSTKGNVGELQIRKVKKVRIINEADIPSIGIGYADVVYIQVHTFVVDQFSESVSGLIVSRFIAFWTIHISEPDPVTSRGLESVTVLNVRHICDLLKPR